jgi:hypothetical protein
MWVRRGSVARLLAVAAIVSVAAAALAADALFPQPLHVTRRIEDLISNTSTTVHEYCAGNQVVTVSGDKVTISDYGRQELTEIDRAAGTYSITPFAELAAAASATPLAHRRRVTTNDAGREPFTATALASPTERGGSGFTVTFADSARGPAKLVIGLDPNVRVSRAALEVLIGASFPNTRSTIHEAILSVAANAQGRGDRRIAANAAPDASYALPVDQSVTFDVDGESITIHSTVLDVRSELVPPGTVTIPPGSRLVESHAVRLSRELREADQLPNTPQP